LAATAAKLSRARSEAVGTRAKASACPGATASYVGTAAEERLTPRNEYSNAGSERMLPALQSVSELF
jgi:hypothetical protein